jgi:hypothetical protein
MLLAVAVKPGFKTTEFLVTVLTAVGAFVAALADALPARYAAIASAVSAGAYAVSRGLAKRPVVPMQVAAPPPPPPSSRPAA